MGPKKYFNQPGHSLFAASDPPDPPAGEYGMLLTI